jgi:hypothetical protein
LARHDISESETRRILDRATTGFISALAVGQALRPLMLDIDVNRTDRRIDVAIRVPTSTADDSDTRSAAHCQTTARSEIPPESRLDQQKP